MTTPGSADPRFPGYDVLGERGTWDDVTTGVVLARMASPAPLRFFTAEEEPTARALVDRLLAQDDGPRIPVVEMIDQRLLAQRGDGYRYDDMPEDWDAWRQSIANLDHDARKAHGQPFAQLGVADQMQLVEDVRKGEAEWPALPVDKTFNLWVRYACDAFYSHPWAWNEIGFGGPAYPRGYKNLGLDRRESWEVAESHPVDPIPWARQAQAARQRHAAAFPPLPGERGSKP